jgi:hypothetical protein
MINPHYQPSAITINHQPSLSTTNHHYQPSTITISHYKHQLLLMTCTITRDHLSPPLL